MKYRPNKAGDAWRDRKGRIWWTTHPDLLPKDPDAYGEIPPQFQYENRSGPPGPPSTARLAAATAAAHRFAELHIRRQRLANAGPDKATFREDWDREAQRIRVFEDWDRLEGPPMKPRDRPLDETEMGLGFAYALAACGYDGRGVGLWGRNAGWGNAVA